jgi:hypothetical protein
MEKFFAAVRNMFNVPDLAPAHFLYTRSARGLPLWRARRRARYQQGAPR